MRVSSAIQRFGLCVVSCLGAIAFLWLSGEASPLLAVVTAICIYGGRRIALLAIGICALALGFYYFPAEADFQHQLHHWLRVIIFLAIAMIVILLVQDDIRAGLQQRAEASGLSGLAPGMPGLEWPSAPQLRGKGLADGLSTKEDAAGACQRRLGALMDAVPALIWSATPEGRPFYFSRRMLDYVGLTREELALSPFQGVHPDDIPAFSRAWREAVEAGLAFTFTYRLRSADRTYRWYEGRAEPVRSQTGALTEWYVTNVDIDDRKQGESALHAVKARLARASQLASLAELSASVAHEVNQPLASVVTNSYACQHWLSDTPPNLERARLTMKRIIRDANAAADVVARVRTLFKDGAPTRTPLNLNDIILDVHRLIRDEFASRKIGFETDLDGDLPTVMADRIQMQQLLLNLMRNGLEAVDAKGNGLRSLAVCSRRGGPGWVIVEIGDSGCGVVDAQKMFEPFFTTKDDGMGMGLAISRSIVEQHEGRLWVSRSEPTGTTISFSLPVHVDHAG